MNRPILFIIPGACSFGSLLSLEWLKIPYQVGITTPEIRSSLDFKKINPTGKVGALKDNEIVIGENLAILLYLADNYDKNNNICPKNRVKIYQWLSYISSTLHNTFSQVLFPERYINPNQKILEEFKRLALNRLNLVLKYIESQLIVTNLFCENYLTIVDGQAYGLLRWINGFKGGNPILDINDYPNIKSFLSLMEQDNGVKNALQIENSKLGKLIHSKFAGYFKF